MIDNQLKHLKIQNVNRDQHIFMPTDIDQLIDEDHPARGIWDFVGKLNLNAFYESIESEKGESGRPAYDPHMLISIWIYAYSKGIGSAREISRLCEEDFAFRWLCGCMSVNHHTLSDFRIAHKEALDKLFTEILGILTAEGLITLERVGQDGTKIKADAGVDTFRRENKIKHYIEEAKKQMKGLEKEEEVTNKIKDKKQQTIQERAKRLEHALTELEKIREGSKKKTEEKKKESRVSTTDPEARIMKQSNGGYNPSYNVQIAADAMHNMIVGVSVIQSAADYNEAPKMMEQIRERTGKNPQEYVVDGGFISRETIIESEKKVKLIGPIQEDSAKKAAERFKERGISENYYTDKFKYDEEKDCFICPGGKKLPKKDKEQLSGAVNIHYRSKEEVCSVCENKKECCPNQKSRGVVRRIEDPVVTKFKNEMKDENSKNIFKTRGKIIEFVNACIKTRLGIREFHVRGLKKVTTEMIWIALTHNIKQWIQNRWKTAYSGI